VNPRVSRSSALASKATGYPIARVAAKIAIGKRLDEIPNAVTKKTTAAFEPALDYVVVKIPRWPFDKFAAADRTLGTQMKATGEVMAIDRSFEASLLKALRSLEVKGQGLLWEAPAWVEVTDPTRFVDEFLSAQPTDDRLWRLFAALRRGAQIELIHERTRIDRWFLRKIARIVRFAEDDLQGRTPTPALLRAAKRMGFADADIATLTGMLPADVRRLRTQWGIRPVYKMVDTCAAEFEAVTPYFYSTYEQENEATPLVGPKAVILGGEIAGPSADAIALAEDRRRFHDFADALGIPQPPGGTASSPTEALAVATEIGYPVLVRPSYVLGGRGMEIAYGPEDLERYFRSALEAGTGRVLVDKYLRGKEVEVDAVSDGSDTLVAGIMEHIERAGVDSGDSYAVYPA